MKGTSQLRNSYKNEIIGITRKWLVSLYLLFLRYNIKQQIVALIKKINAFSNSQIQIKEKRLDEHEYVFVKIQ